MNAKSSTLMAMLFTALPLLPCFSISNPNQRPQLTSNRSTGDDLGSVIRQIRNNLSDLKHEVSNHELEIRTFEEKLHNQDLTFEHMREELSEDISSQKDYIRSVNINMEMRIDQLERKIDGLDEIVRGIISDLKQLKTQSNESINALNYYKQHLSEIEKVIEAQHQHMASLEGGLNSIVELLQAKEQAEKIIAAAARPTDSKTYKVQPGDSLGKIAQQHKVSIQALREANHLTQDKIVIGQTLKIP